MELLLLTDNIYYGEIQMIGLYILYYCDMHHEFHITSIPSMRVTMDTDSFPVFFDVPSYDTIMSYVKYVRSITDAIEEAMNA